MERPLYWLGGSLDDLKEFPIDVRKEAGHQLNRVQQGLDPEDWKPFSGVAPGVREIRIRGDDGAYRIMYVAKFESGVYVLHCFRKKTQKTRQSDIELARKRFQQLQM